jgi:monoamine oxidase
MPHARPSQETRIAIVGAGIAGLNAALTLQDAGLACTIYEAADYIGAGCTRILQPGRIL